MCVNSSWRWKVQQTQFFFLKISCVRGEGDRKRCSNCLCLWERKTEKWKRDLVEVVKLIYDFAVVMHYCKGRSMNFFLLQKIIQFWRFSRWLIRNPKGFLHAHVFFSFFSSTLHTQTRSMCNDPSFKITFFYSSPRTRAGTGLTA